MVVKKTDKAKVLIKDWMISRYSDGTKFSYNLSGNAENHPVLGKTFVAHTSYFVDANVDGDVLYFETANTMYVAPLKYASVRKDSVHLDTYLKEARKKDIQHPAIDNVYNAVLKFELSDADRKSRAVVMTSFDTHFLELILTGKQDREAEIKLENERLIAEAKKYDDCLYMEVENIACGSLVAYNINGKTGVSEPYLHTGRLQDSVLYSAGREFGDSFDFRYFPNGDSMSTYCWSSEIKRVVIKNMKKYAIYFNGEEIAPDALRVFERTK